ncbi:MAG: ferritin-like domain-containing protein, partial [Sphaerochaeta sp.]
MDKLIELLNKVIRDEISAYIFYINCANSAVGLGVKPIVDELIEHAKEELEHYHKIITYCSDYNLQDKIQIVLDESIVNIHLTNINEIVSKVQELEHQSIVDYNCLIMLCKEINDEKGLKLSKLSEKPPL